MGTSGKCTSGAVLCARLQPFAVAPAPSWSCVGSPCLVPQSHGLCAGSWGGAQGVGEGELVGWRLHCRPAANPVPGVGSDLAGSVGRIRCRVCLRS